MFDYQFEIFRLLSYFDIFNHPLKKEEIQNLSSIDEESIELTLNTLVKNKKCFFENEYYGFKENIQESIQIREKKEKEAAKYLAKLPFYARLIKSFPFVKAIAISGSLSKNIMHDKGDIDYFIITTANRLWICRTLLILFKKIFLLNNRKYFCVNYFVDENNLKILDENIFTAVEVTYLIPVYNEALIKKFKKVNSWTEDYFINFKHPITVNIFEGKKKLKSILESFFKNKIGDRIDLYFMKLTYNRWSKKFSYFDASKFELTMRSNRGISKHHPLDFQNKVLKELDKRLEKLETN